MCFRWFSRVMSACPFWSFIVISKSSNFISIRKMRPSIQNHQFAPSAHVFRILFLTNSICGKWMSWPWNKFLLWIFLFIFHEKNGKLDFKMRNINFHGKSSEINGLNCNGLECGFWLRFKPFDQLLGTEIDEGNVCGILNWLDIYWNFLPVSVIFFI
jgi:hypothetical protein